MLDDQVGGAHIRPPARSVGAADTGGDDVVVLCYHTVGDAWNDPMSVRPRALREQLEWLKSRGYRGVRFSEAVLGPGAGKRVAITFDDGFHQVYRFAYPVMAELQMPATVFVPTDFVGQGTILSWRGMDVTGADATELQPLSWTELEELTSTGWEVGSHSCSHARLSQLTARQLDRELRASRARCEHELGITCRAIAYPFGEVDLRTRTAAAAAGYEAGAALARPAGPPDALAWPRVSVYRGDSLRRFRAKVARPARTALAAWALRTIRGIRTTTSSTVTFLGSGGVGQA